MEVWAYKKLRPLLKKSKAVKEAFEKYPEFARMDVDKMDTLTCKLYLLVWSPFILAKFIFGWGSFVLLWVWCKILLLFHKKDGVMHRDSFSYQSVKFGSYLVGRYAFAFFGIP